MPRPDFLSAEEKAPETVPETPIPEFPAEEADKPLDPPELPKDENGDPIAPPDGFRPPRPMHGGRPPEPPKDENGNPVAPPDGFCPPAEEGEAGAPEGTGLQECGKPI